VIVGMRHSNDSLYQSLIVRKDELKAAGIKSVKRIGDALAPGALVHAVYSGHEYARNLDKENNELYLRDLPITDNGFGAVFKK
jgi:dimethylamine/trimethylamine dehydrogenase